MTYKPEIDGIRAIGVLFVLFCHMQLGLPGGFIGVDIFFVISGFLITSIVLAGIEKGNFGFWNFYGKRFMRLYPALIVVTLATFMVGFLIFDAETLKNLARSGRYAITSLSNIYFQNNLGYFDQGAQKQIFLHTWSLGVEWQFYLLWPMLMWLALKISRNALIALLLVITIASLALSQWMLTDHAQAAYYMMPSRAFELGIGALLVFVYPKNLSPPTGAGLTATGFLAMMVAGFIYTPETPFPGVAALLPCLGAAACIWGAKAFSTGNFLRLPPVVYIGKISYSAYLVHWPVLVFYKYYIYRNIVLSEKIALFIASLALGALVYHLVETRINWRKVTNRRAALTTMIVITLASVCGFYYVGRSGEGLPWRITQANPLKNPEYQEWGIAKFPDIATLGQADGKLVAIVGGDSFAANMSTGLDEYLTPLGKRVERFYLPGCLISQQNFGMLSASNECRELSKEALAAVQQNPGIPLILIQAWGGPIVQDEAQGKPFDLEKQTEYNKNIAQNLDHLREIVGDSHPIFLVASPPYRHWASGEKECLLRPGYVPQLCINQIQPYPVEKSPVSNANVALQSYAQANPNFYYIDTAEIACPGGICTSEFNGKLYFDGFHTSKFGGRIIIQHVMKQVQDILHARQEGL